MRLAFLTHEPFYPPSGGGSAEAVYLVQELVQRGHEVHLFCPAFPDPAAIEKRFCRAPGASSGAKRGGSRAAQRPVAEQASGLPSSAQAMGGGAGQDSPPGEAKGDFPGRLRCHLFTTWQMGRYASLRNFKYLAYPLFLERMFGRKVDLVMPRAVRNRFFLQAVNRQRKLVYAA